MQLSNYNYILPKSAIAQHPPITRGEAKLLVVDRLHGDFNDSQYDDILHYLVPGDVLVLNDTKVIKARLIAYDNTNREHELVMLERHGDDQDTKKHKVLYRGSLVVGQQLRIGNAKIVIEDVLDGGIATISSDQPLDSVVESQGHVPLPPYMKRSATKHDEERYQTIFASRHGSVAAPTASLNMTDELLARLQSKGVVVCYLTLHVGLGTFLPIRVDDITTHKMHSEYFEIPTETTKAIQEAKQQGKRVFALGTTVARTLEYTSNNLLTTTTDLSGEADIFIYPGYTFKIIDGLITNFHAPKSTVLMLVAAFAGWDKLEAAYIYALKHNYRFLSYGDSMLVL